jgi:hypothetical protein
MLVKPKTKKELENERRETNEILLNDHSGEEDDVSLAN